MDKHNSQITINVSFNQQNHTFTINHGISIAELKQMIFTHFQIDTMTYCLLYKSYKLSLEDKRPVFTILTKEKYPLFFVMKKSAVKKLKQKKQPLSVVTIRSKMPETKFLKLLNDFFKSKYIPFQAQIDNQTLGVYNVKFQNETIAQEFHEFFEMRLKSERLMNHLPILHSSSSASVNTSSSKISKRTNKTYLPKINRSVSSRYMCPEEKRIHEAFLDKKNWINKAGFIVSAGKYSFHDRYISNYVNMTPSEPPVNHKYREINKKKWITEKGFC